MSQLIGATPLALQAANRVEEIQYFEDLFSTAVSDARMNHTPSVPGCEESPDKAAYLYWIDGNQQFPAAEMVVGPFIALKVKPGDNYSLEMGSFLEKLTSFHGEMYK